MAYQIGALCIRCDECVEICPVGAIIQGDACYEIDQELCVSCGSCVDNCAFGVITEV